MVNLIVTERIRLAIHVLISREGTEQELVLKLQPYVKVPKDVQVEESRIPKTIPHTLLSKLSQALERQASDESFSLQTLVHGSCIHLQPPPPRTKSPELVKILDDIKAELANREYAEMTKNVSFQRDSMRAPLNIGGELRDAFRSLSAVFNVLLSIAAVFAAVFWVSGTVTQDIGKRTLLSLFGALMVAIAEGWFFAKDLLHVDVKTSHGPLPREKRLPTPYFSAENHTSPPI
ncbi:endoplasmic reticulum-based factor for assembly of V-ATPase-domain-containing protein [Powellomyces hirtus]|nr:endoplasmic reticulum-based factor for assembly of V-ATPase-domain-containing protein [Powellomyces hirtus]